MLKAAIIDDGVKQCLYENWIITSSDIKQAADCVFNSGVEYTETHAEKCYKIIEHYLPDSSLNEILWYNIKILDEIKLKADVSSFVKALELCLEKQVKFIHLSIGSSSVGDFEQINAIIEKLLSNNVIIVAATNNRGTITYPACMQGIFGVKHNPFYTGKYYTICSAPRDGIRLSASSDHHIQQVYVTKSNSFAAPLISSIILEYLVENPQAGIAEIWQYLEKAKPQFSCSYGYISNSSDKYALLKQWYKQKHEPPCPIVVLCGFDEYEMLSILESLYQQFLDDGYNAKAASDSSAANRQRFCQIPMTRYINEYLNYLSYYFQCDILLVGIIKKRSVILKTDDMTI